ncbi:hypothetical protein AKI39_05175 [Bordetella sp. H567]|uniref:DUF2846 domain-containing protein n=1 Tax=Bordetella sp. H567 TaxID=1697043 RepID=UPI00081CF095|nr:DUF2846 domain-containing protein [Bordetella sp. H567]AOB30214.1 hypothetical protein AKI39_05175 [Bordetella sp. H567]
MRPTSVKTLLSIGCLILVTGCASVPMESADKNLKAKSFPTPDQGKSGLYVYRDSFVGKALKKDVYLDGNCVGETADKVFFYTQVDGDHTYQLSTESEFSPNDLKLDVNAGKNYFVRQFIKMGVFVGGAGLESVPEDEGKRVISKPDVNLAAMPGHCDHTSIKAAANAAAQK